MFKSKSQSNLLLLALVFSAGLILLLAVTTVANAQSINDPMKPPAFALNKFRLAKLKQNGAGLTAKSSVKKSQAKPLQLSSILIGKSRKVAIINDQTLVVGDKIGKYKLVAIFKDRVQLSGNGKRTTLKLHNEITAIKKTAVENKL